MFQTKVLENVRTHILCSITFFFENPAFFEIMCKHIVEPDDSTRTAHGHCMLDT